MKLEKEVEQEIESDAIDYNNRVLRRHPTQIPAYIAGARRHRKRGYEDGLRNQEIPTLYDLFNYHFLLACHYNGVCNDTEHKRGVINWAAMHRLRIHSKISEGLEKAIIYIENEINN